MTEAERQIAVLLAQAQMDREAVPSNPSALAAALTQHIPEDKPRFGRWQPETLASGQNAKAGIVGKLLGALGLDADGNRAATSWSDAAKHTAGNLINAPQDVANQLLDLQDYQPVYGTGVSNPEDRARAGQQAVATFGLAGLAPLGGVVAGRAARNSRHVDSPQPHAAPPELRVEAPPSPVAPSAVDLQADILNRVHQQDMGRVGEATLQRAIAPEAFSGITPEGNLGNAAKFLMPEPGQDPVPGVRRLDGSALYANSKEGAVPGLLAQAGERVQALYEPGNQVNIFGGQNAKTADQAKLKSAMDMAAAGLPREQIWNETGWFTGADGKWRFEIDDSKARMGDFYSDAKFPAVQRAHVPQGKADYVPQAMPLEDYIRHPELERAYWPTREQAPSVIFDDLGAARGKYTPGNDFLTMDSGSFLRADEGKSTALHELQHAIQSREQFARGYNPNEAAKDIGQARLREQELRGKTERWQNAHSDEARVYETRALNGDPEAVEIVKASQRWMDQLGAKSDDNPYGITRTEAIAAELGERDEVLQRGLKEYQDVFRTSRLDPHDLYKMHAGETEARTVQKRMDLTPEQRAARPPWLDYDVPENQQIVRFNDTDTTAVKRLMRLLTSD